jgi:glutamate formiminotransferase / 5-formyltetrahydrofolate cyclo-ligase
VAAIACVPNVSEGRRRSVIDALAAAVASVPGVTLLDYSADISHNRSVFTFVGRATAVEQAVVALYERAVAAIDLRTHRGVHPRMGAVDVVPFVPIGGETMAACVSASRRTAAVVASRFQIPVYLYEESATRPDRRNLETIRRGGFEGLAARMSLPAWAPDFGPLWPHPTAGASAIGARPPLIAFNVNLASDRIDIAKSIARAVRESSGGLPFLKALGVRLDERGIVQVSMNLTNYRRTSMRQAFDAVKSEANRRGIDVLESEVIGTVPPDALSDSDLAALQLRARPPLLAI